IQMPNETSNAIPSVETSSSPPPYASQVLDANSSSPTVPFPIISEQPPSYDEIMRKNDDNRSTTSSIEDFTWRDIFCCWLFIQGWKIAGGKD
ncbi:hypothetical protein PFISCL1PPCAC_28664, partial [Pristionchus fissidentatus]